MVPPLTHFWYFARYNELLLDLDSEYALGCAVLKLRRAIRLVFLDVERYIFFESSPGKFHGFVTLQKNWRYLFYEKTLWRLWLGSDFYRELYSSKRHCNGLSEPDLLIARQDYFLREFCGTGKLEKMDRRPDAECNCKRKHTGTARALACPVFQKIHGSESGKVYFPLNNDRTTKLVKIIPGKIYIK